MRLCYHCMHQIQDNKLQICPNCGKSLRIEHTSAKFLRPGTMLQGKFIIGNPLGAGGFGNTYIGFNRMLLQKVAIKEFYPEQYSTRAGDGVTVSVTNTDFQSRFRVGLQQFLEEARSIAALQDIKGVVKISSFFEENGTGYIVMEYLEGTDVKTILQRSGGRKNYEWCRRVTLTVLHTIRDIHKRGVLHRDIAPDNVFVTNDGVIKLIDFGAARHASVFINPQAEIVLKAGYAPIEQYSREARQGAYTDLYAVAALFYRMLTGQKPIPANERAVGNDPLIPPSGMGIRIPEQAEMGIMVCLNIRPEYRLQSADELMEAFDGRYFVPVYDREWIFPPVEKEKQGFLHSLSAPAKAALCVGVLCLFILLIGGGVVLSKYKKDNHAEIQSAVADGMVRLEDYAGQPYDEVVQSLKRKGLQNITEPIYDYNTASEGTVIAQSIPASTVISQGEALTLTVSGGDSKFTMPDFSSYSEEQVIQYFTDKNFDVTVEEDPYGIKESVKKGENTQWSSKVGKVRVRSRFSEIYKKGNVIDQSFSARKLYDGSADIIVACSYGKEQDYLIKMPDLTGLSKKEAAAKIKKAKLQDVLKVKYREDSDYSDSVAAGSVLKQSIKPKEKVNTLTDQDKKLVVYLSKGPKPTPKPIKTPRPIKTPKPIKKSDRGAGESSEGGVGNSGERGVGSGF